MAEVTLQGISKSFGATTALDDVTMTIPDGSFVVLLGPTGAGKTTTLRMVSGLDRPDLGRITIGGREMTGLTPAQRDVAMVFQHFSLFDALSVAVPISRLDNGREDLIIETLLSVRARVAAVNGNSLVR